MAYLTQLYLAFLMAYRPFYVSILHEKQNIFYCMLAFTTEKLPENNFKK